jgi:predicted GIY-YIG superfamily endonuclease
VGFIYFIKDNSNQVKIGYTKRNVEKRVKELNSPNLSIILEFESKYPTKLEKALHFRFKQYNIEREWFNLTDFSIEELKKICYTLEEGINTIKQNNNFL